MEKSLDFHRFSGKFKTAIGENKYILLFADSDVFNIYKNEILAIFELHKLNCKIILIQARGENKNLRYIESLMHEMAELKISCNYVLVSFGGGITTDIAAFVSLLYLRGIRLIHIPTTLLAMVDASIGDKTGLNMQYGKNLIGAFKTPMRVIHDSIFLKTLPERFIRDGIAEIIKCCFIIKSNDLLIKKLLPYETEKDLEVLLFEAIRVKNEILEIDKRISGTRTLLNFGHTIGHALEISSNYNLTHGVAVGIGMSIISKAAMTNKICDQKCC